MVGRYHRWETDPHQTQDKFRVQTEHREYLITACGRGGHLCGQSLDIRRDAREPFLVGVLDDRGQKTLGGLYGDADVDVLVLPCEVRLP